MYANILLINDESYITVLSVYILGLQGLLVLCFLLFLSYLGHL